MEELADARASQVSNSPERYAALLLDIAQRRVGKDPTFALAMARRQSNIGRRIKRILGGESLIDLKPVHRLARFSTAIASLLVVGVLIAGFGWQKAPKDPVKYGWQVPTGMAEFHILAPGGGEAVDAHAWMLLGRQDMAMQTQELSVDDNGWVHVDFSKIAGAFYTRIFAKDADGNIGMGLPRPDALKTDLVLIKPITVKGVLKKPDGSPAEGIQISADRCIFLAGTFRQYLELRDSPLASQTTTGPNGEFTLSGIASESVMQVSISDPEYQRPTRAIKRGNSTAYGLKIGAGPVFDLGEIKLESAGTVSGRVTLDGKGVPGIRVSAQITNDDTFKTPLASWGDGTTDANGRYLIGGLANARYNVAIFMPKNLAKDYACAAIDSLAVEVGKQLMQRDLRLERGAIVEGDVFLKGNPDPEGYPVYYYGPDHPESGAWCGSAHCDAKGHFRFRVSPGKQRVYLAMAQPINEGQVFTVQAGETVHVTLKE